MKKVLFVLFCLSVLSVDAQDFKFPKKTTAKVMPVAGTMLMMDQTEVPVSEWLAYVYSVWKQNEDMTKSQIVKYLPKKKFLPKKYHEIFEFFSKQFDLDDMDGYLFNDMISGTCYQHYEMPLPFDWEKDTIEAYNTILQLPMVGISYEQIRGYLRWREKIFNADKYILKKSLRAKARLISPFEWDTLVMNCGIKMEANTTVYPDTINEEGCYLLNVKNEIPCAAVKQVLDKFDKGALPVEEHFIPDNCGFYNLLGNVAEMTSEKGLSKGGSFRSYAKDCLPFEAEMYENPAPWLGFRVVFDFNRENF